MPKYYISGGNHRLVVEKQNIKEAAHYFINSQKDLNPFGEYIFISERGFKLTKDFEDVPEHLINDPKYILDINEVAVFNTKDFKKEYTS